jgi:hypothetical protein
MIIQTTLYYFFSTIAQVIAASVALIAVLVHFRILALRDFLVGDGKSIVDGKDDKREGYEILNTISYYRLKDSVSRKDIGGIKEVLTQLSNSEKDGGFTIENRPRGFQWLLTHFESTEKQIDEMAKTSKRSFVFAFLTSFYSIIAILFVELIINNLCCLYLLIGISIILLAICGYYFIKGIILSFKNFTRRFSS